MELPRGAAGGRSTHGSGPSTPTVNKRLLYGVDYKRSARSINETQRLAADLLVGPAPGAPPSGLLDPLYGVEYKQAI